MVQTTLRFLSFEEYLSYDDGTENLYELFNGRLVPVPPEPGLNVAVANRLFLRFALRLGTDRIRGHGLELEVRGEPKNRYPDLTIVREEHIPLLKPRNTLRLSTAPPVLVVEIASPGELQWERDYVAKRSQYEGRAILEYWIVDPQEQSILILELAEGTYREAATLQGDEPLRSLQLGELGITAAQIFAESKSDQD